MNRYVLAVLVNLEPDKLGACGGFETSRRIYDKLVEISSSSSSSELPPFPACSLSGSPGLQKCYFAVQMTYGLAQFCSAEWEEVCVERSDSEETAPSAVDSCISAVQDQEESESTTLTELFEEAAEALHQLADKLPPPGHFLLDVLMLCEDKEGLKEFLPVIGALKHMQAWHSALVNIVTEHSTGWRTAASYLSARVRSPAEALDCIDERELWRGGLWLRERKFVSELVFEGFSLKVQSRSSWSRVLNPERLAERKLHSEVRSLLEFLTLLLVLWRVGERPLLPVNECLYLMCADVAYIYILLSHDFWLVCVCVCQMGALFALSCVISTEAFPPASQLSASRWRDFMSKRPKVLSVPEVELKGEKGHYLLLVQGVESGGCKARLMHSANQINGTVALGTINGLIRETLLSSSGTSLTSAWLQSLPRLHGEQLLHREKGVDRVQMRVLQECLRRREEVQKPAALPLNELKVLLNLAREQYLNTQNTTLPRVSDSEPAEPKHTRLTQSKSLVLLSEKRSLIYRSIILNVVCCFICSLFLIFKCVCVCRLCKSESSESVCSQGSVSSVTHPTVRALRQQAGRSLSTSSTADTHTPGHTHADPKPTCSQPESRSQKHNRMLKEVVLKTLKHHGISSDHKCFQTCSRRLFDVSKLYLKDLKTSRGLHEEMKKAAGRNAKQVTDTHTLPF
uniref:MDM2 binding protein n=1 Tax=Astyanax mexicanus TaxID=7994 RepID=A0A8B9HD55_ASTMX